MSTNNINNDRFIIILIPSTCRLYVVHPVLSVSDLANNGSMSDCQVLEMHESPEYSIDLHYGHSE